MLERKAGTFYYVRCLRTVVSAALVCLLFVAAFAPLANGQACVSGPDIIQDGGFEIGPPDQFWPLWDIQTFSELYPICTTALCPTDLTYLPRTGTSFIWFASDGDTETMVVGQTVDTVPTSGTSPVVATLSYWMKAVAGAAPATDTLQVVVDNVVVQTFTEVSVTEAGYTERIVNFVLTPGTHTIEFRYNVNSQDDLVSSFLIDDVTLNACTVTAATADISGRVVLPNGRGLANTSVTLTDQLGVTLTARTNSFGFYSFDDVRVGPSYVLQPISSRYTFSPQVITPVDDMGGVNFVAGQ